MNMPFEFGVDLGFRRARDSIFSSKRFIIFECDQYDLKRALSDLAGADVEFHNNDFRKAIKKLRDFFSSEAKIPLPGLTKIETDYYTFLGWMTEKKISEGHTEAEAKELPTAERLSEMVEWVLLGGPEEFS